jgi:hypothetical protein
MLKIIHHEQHVLCDQVIEYLIQKWGVPRHRKAKTLHQARYDAFGSIKGLEVNENTAVRKVPSLALHDFQRKSRLANAAWSRQGEQAAGRFLK